MDTPECTATCKQCQKNFPAPNRRFKVCSPECQAILDAAYVRPPRPTITLTCLCCGLTVTRTAVRYDHGKYCSRPCAYAGRSITRGIQAALDREEKAAAQALRKAEQEAQRAMRLAEPPAPVLRDCTVCGVTFVRERKRQTICTSDLCQRDERKRRALAKRKAPSSIRQRRITKAKRRAAEGSENIDPIEVFTRDEWRCYICGIDTPRHERGTSSPTAPELEHVVSLADGGPHTWSNVACACRWCNALKGSISFHSYVVIQDGPQHERPDWSLLLK